MCVWGVGWSGVDRSTKGIGNQMGTIHVPCDVPTHKLYYYIAYTCILNFYTELVRTIKKTLPKTLSKIGT